MLSRCYASCCPSRSCLTAKLASYGRSSCASPSEYAPANCNDGVGVFSYGLFKGTNRTVAPSRPSSNHEWRRGTGRISIDILKSGHPENYWQYEVRPTIGSVRNVKEETFRDYSQEDIPHDFLRPAGAIGACPSETKATSLDRTFLAYCAPSEAGLVMRMRRLLESYFSGSPRSGEESVDLDGRPILSQLRF